MRVLGCDIGNGFAYVSVLDATSGLPVGALPPQWAATGMPTEAYVQADGSIVVGQAPMAEERDPRRVLRAMKRLLAKGQLELAGVGALPAANVYAAVAGRALTAALQTLAARGDPAPHQVVLTYPAAFADSRRLIATMRSAVAGLRTPDGDYLQVAGAIPEPASVALDYLHFMRDEVAPDQRIRTRDATVVVYDLGYGTFDTALVTARAVRPGDTERSWDLHDYDGLAQVGGIDFDEALIGLLAGRLPAGCDARDPYVRDLLREQAVRCKHQLSDAPEAEVRLFLPNGTPARLAVTRAEFEDATAPLLAQTIEKLQGMLASAARLGETVTHVVLSGGSSRMPMVRRAVQELVGPQVTVSLFRPSEAVSFGAARYGQTIRRQEARTPPLDDAATAEERMDRLFLPLLAALPTAPLPVDDEPAAPALVQHVPHPLGVLYASRRGRMMQALLPKGATGASAAGLLSLRADDPHVELVVARAQDPADTRRRLPEDAFLEVCHLTCDAARPNTTYDVRICLDDDGTVHGILTDEHSHTITMEMS